MNYILTVDKITTYPSNDGHSFLNYITKLYQSCKQPHTQARTNRHTDGRTHAHIRIHTLYPNKKLETCNHLNILAWYQVFVVHRSRVPSIAKQTRLAHPNGAKMKGTMHERPVPNC